MDRREAMLATGAVLLAGSAPSSAAEPPAPPALPVPDAWEEAERMALWPGGAPDVAQFDAGAVPAGWPASYRRAVREPELRVFRPARANGRAVVLIPGGAYWFVSFVNEGVDVARRLNEQGYTVFVLIYRLPGEGWRARADVPLQDAQRAVRWVRSKAADYRVDPATIAVIGFSAGGHLAATLATGHRERLAPGIDAIDGLDARPHAVALIYPVITMREPGTHGLSRQLLLGERPSTAAVERRSAERHVDATTPPLFQVHAIDDAAVPVQNSLEMLAAMRAAKRPVEAHLLQEGGHAFGVGRPDTPSAQWLALFDAWLRRTPA